jgi:hypothetical protein
VPACSKCRAKKQQSRTERARTMPFSASFYLLVCAAAAAAISATTAVASAQDICPGDLSSYVNQVRSAPSAAQRYALKSRGRCSLTTRSCWQGRCLASMSEPAPPPPLCVPMRHARPADQFCASGASAQWLWLADAACRQPPAVLFASIKHKGRSFHIPIDFR